MTGAYSAGDFTSRTLSPAHTFLKKLKPAGPNQITKRYFAKLRGALKPGARLAIIDFRVDAPYGPPKKERIPPTQVKAELGRAGYALAKEHDFLPNQFFLVFEAKP